MARFRTAITIVALLAVAANSAAAAFRPRCCRTERPEQSKRACCAQAEDEPAAAEPASCCRAKQVAVQSRWAVTWGTQPCCCQKSLPAVPAVRESIAARARSEVQPAIIGEALALDGVPPARDRIRNYRPGTLVPAAPPISVLYCVWLK